MHPPDLQPERPHARAPLAVAALLIVGLTGCATEPTPRTGSPATEAMPYAGVFTGEFVDGKPLYRLPTIEVVGARSSVLDGESSELDRSPHGEPFDAATRAKSTRLREELRAAGR